jgi:uncharacterized repeat protein (TIGR03803 family)
MSSTQLPRLPESIVAIRPIYFAALLIFLTCAYSAASAQSFRVLHAFTYQDGGSPTAGVTLDAAGNIYGTASTGGVQNGGSVFELKRSGSSWIFNTLHLFVLSEGDGSTPLGGVTFAPGGALVGTTAFGDTGGCYAGCGTVFSLRAPQNSCRSGNCPWNERIIHNFDPGSGGGAGPKYEELVFDSAGNMYGTTCDGGGAPNAGTVFEMTLTGNYTTLHAFTGPDGACPASGVVFDGAGNLFGTSDEGGSAGVGVAYELSPSGSGSWNLTLLHSFTFTESTPFGGLVADALGNFYGMTTNGNVYKLTQSNGAWNFSVVIHLPGQRGGFGAMAIDAAGNLYGTQYQGGKYAVGAVFKLSPNNGSWTYTDLYDFDTVSGAFPEGWVTLDSHGNLYGTATHGGIVQEQHCGDRGCGTVWEITP